jgi:hypothetical protein
MCIKRDHAVFSIQGKEREIKAREWTFSIQSGNIPCK